MSDPLTGHEQFTLRTEMGKLMRAARIARPDSLYEASVSGPIFATIEESVVNPIDVGEIVDVNLARATRAENYPHIPGGEGYGRNSKKGHMEANRANFPMEVERLTNRKSAPKSKIWRIYKKRLRN